MSGWSATRGIGSLVLASCAQVVQAQEIPPAPRGEWLSYQTESNWTANPTADTATVFTEEIRVPGASWVRVYFAGLELEGASLVRVTSLLDGEYQELDATQAAVWSYSTAYFNGDSVLVELVASPGSQRNHLVIDRVETAFLGHEPEPAEGSSGQCGICGSDDRVPANQAWSARLMPAACTASVYNSCSCLVSAGHCMSSGMVVQFNVPNSQSNCGLVNPPVADQFPIVAHLSAYIDIGKDWAVLKAGANNLGQLPYQRYGQLRPIANTAAIPGESIGIWAYGIDSNCVNNQRQQYAAGVVNVVGSSTVQFSADLRGGASGTGVIQNGSIIGVATNCTVGCPNVATAVGVSAFAAARAALCPCTLGQSCPADLTHDNRVDVDDLVVIIMSWGPCPISPTCIADCESPHGIVDVNDLMMVINAWGACP